MGTKNFFWCGRVFVTPEMAAVWLRKQNKVNRKLRSWQVRMLEGALKRGERRMTSDAIGFDINGLLVNGQHRLQSCVSSGIGFWSLLVIGLEEKAFTVTDRGMARTYWDLLRIDKRISEVLTAGVKLVLGNSKPTYDQIQLYADAGLRDVAEGLIASCGASRRYFSSAYVKLAACVAVMDGEDQDFVFNQYWALCSRGAGADQKRTTATQAFITQKADDGKHTIDKHDVLARALKVFRQAKSGISKISVSDEEKRRAIDLVRYVLKTSLEERNFLGEKESGPGFEAESQSPELSAREVFAMLSRTMNTTHPARVDSGHRG